MDNKSFDAHGCQYAWDATSLKLAEECPRKYYYQMIEGWRSASASNVHLRFGSLYATALEHYYKHRALDLSSQEALEEVVLEALLDTWDRPKCETCTGTGRGMEMVYYGGPPVERECDCPDCNGTGYVGDGAPWQSDHAAKTRENLIRTIIWYVDQFENEATEVVMLADGKPAVELSFSLEVDDGIVFCGHLDRLVTYAHDKYVMDQKTTGSTISNNYFEGYNPDIQFSMYTFAGQSVFHIPLRGVIIDAAQIAVGFSRFERGFTFRSAAQLSEWYDEMLTLIETTQGYARENHFPMNRSSCGNYGGCPFRKVCSRDPAVRPNFLAADFVKGPSWDPLERR